MTEAAKDELIDHYANYFLVAKHFRRRGMDDTAVYYDRLCEVIMEVAVEYDFVDELNELKNLATFEHEKALAAYEAARAGKAS